MAGGEFCHSLTAFAPERVIAFAAVKSQEFRTIPNPGLLRTPALLIAGEKDSIKRVQGVTNLLYHSRPEGALWCLAIERNAQDEVGWSADLAIPFFKVVATKRLPTQGGAVHFRDLKPIASTDGWLGEIRTRRVAPLSDFTGRRDRACWFPDEGVARAWQTFMQGERVRPGHPRLR